MLEINNLSVAAKERKLLDNVSLVIPHSGAVGLTGSSGAGKTTLIRAIMGISDDRLSISGSILCDEENLMKMSKKERRRLGGTVIGFVPQNPMTAFNPYLRILAQLEETLCPAKRISKTECRNLAMKLFEKVNLHDPERVYESFPAQLSGGMLQRITIAFLIGMNPRYILADEPTSALDEENRQILVRHLKEMAKTCGVLLISHDIRSMEELCEKVFVMEQGRISAEGKLTELLEQPSTEWLKKFSAAWIKQRDGERLWMD